MDNTKDRPSIKFLIAQKEDLDRLEEIRGSAFQAIFDSFRNILGETIYEFAQLPEDIAQKDMLLSFFNRDSIWKTWKVTCDDKTVGFIAIRMDEQSKVGEIGLNAVDPAYSGMGIGTQMYNFAVESMKKGGMKVATVATGGDPAHFPARKAYRKAGFNVEIPSVWMCQELE